MKTIAAVTLTVLALAPAARAEDHFKLFLNGSFALGSIDYTASRTLTQFVEDGSLDSQYKADSAVGFEGGLQYLFNEHLGVQAAVSGVSRDTGGSFTASLPHPLYFNQPRSAAGDLTGLSYKETTIHLDLVYAGRSGPVEVSVFAGASFFKVKSDLVQNVVYDQSYPYDTVTVTGTPTENLSDSPVGFNAGAALDYRIGDHFGLGGQLRFSRATATLNPQAGSPVSIDAGGLQASVGVRAFF